MPTSETPRGRILIVDDDPSSRTALSELLSDEGYESELAQDGFKALAKFAEFGPDLVLTDQKMPGLDGLELLRQITSRDETVPVIVVTAFGAVKSAVEALRAGAYDYLTKPVDFDELLAVVDRALRYRSLRVESANLRRRLDEKLAPDNIVGTSPQMQRVFEVVDQVAPSRATVLIMGESGTGKELVASAIHHRSTRAKGPFVKLHCAALAEGLLESELFGHEKGAFTGAQGRRDGRFTMADGGTLFLDEIGEISPATQVKLLRFLQEQEFERVGGNQTLKVDVRVIAATNRNLHEEVAAKRFREDLFYRLNVVSIETPPLRERMSDIPALATFFIAKHAKSNARDVGSMTSETLDVLASYPWPGNVRELENAIERAVVMCNGQQIEARHLPPSLRAMGDRPINGQPPIPGSTLAQLERYAIMETLKAHGGSTSRAAEILGISVRTVQYRLQEYARESQTYLERPRAT
ncbi:MAG: sigma-54-dependent Fis family transcriptional regulator [Myxococcales bacterium]|nr:sigma-54-dependent Fis family transcriptional regulator [Myxococcales bacterium]